jgi:hypothetical protein
MMIARILLTVVFVLAGEVQDNDELDKARKVFTPDITRAILTGIISAPDGFDRAMAEQIGVERLRVLRAGNTVVDGRENDLAVICLLRLGVKRESLKLPAGAYLERRAPLPVTENRSSLVITIRWRKMREAAGHSSGRASRRTTTSRSVSFATTARGSEATFLGTGDSCS